MSQSPTAKFAHDGEEFQLCHRWIRKTWSAEADMKVGLFHGQAAGDRRGLEWQRVYFNVTDKSLGETRRGAAGEQAQVLDECDTFAVPL